MISEPTPQPDYDAVLGSATIAEPLAGARPCTVRDVQRGMVIVRMFARFIEAWLPRERPVSPPECDCEHEADW